MSEFELDGKKFQAGKMPVFTQFHVLRRLGQIFPNIRGAIVIKDKDPLLAASYIAAAFGHLSDEDANFIMNAALSVCTMQQGNLWSAVMVNGALMFQDLHLQTVMQLTWKVLEENFGPFMRDLLSMASAAGIKV